MRSARGRSSRTQIWKAALVVLAVAAAPVGQASAFNFFGLFGSGDTPPAPSTEALPYDLTITIVGVGDGIETAIRDVSSLYRLRADAPPDADALARLAKGDLTAVVDALWGLGYYNAQVTIDVAGVGLRLGANRVDAAIAAAGPFLNTALVPIAIVVDPGQRFSVRNITIRDADTGRTLTAADLPPGGIRLEPGDPASAARILAAQSRIVDHYREQARPFAKVASIEPVVHHPVAAMDLTIAISPGPEARIGQIAVTGADGVDERVIRSFIYVDTGTLYSPKAIADIRTSLGRIEALSSVRVREGEALDADGRLPLTVEATERLPRAFGVSAQFSTTDGPSTRVYWTHRNLFGGAEVLRLEASAFYLTEGGGALFSNRRNVLDDMGGRISASFLKPALGGTRNDFLADARVERDRTDGYDSRLVNVTAGIRHRFSDSFSIQGGVEYERGLVKDITGKRDYRLVGLPLSLNFDSTDSRLEPTHGFRVTGGVAPYLRGLGSSIDMVVSRFNASTYFALDDRARYVIAARIGFGSILGASLAEVPTNRRFFAGGGGSVRGYAFRSLSPTVKGRPIGGRSLLEGSLEARIRVTDTIGVVPFIDAGAAFAESYPDFNENIRVAAGLGLRYYTGIGPIRLDVAIPLTREHGQRGYGIYLGIGQAF
ncbi:MAG: outer membrane protein assembly factor [Salinarimonadaceae bacterium]|nr:MAG: outer membrane protein assembly factor [Salinarimonadaceae bacterium]